MSTLCESTEIFFSNRLFLNVKPGLSRGGGKVEKGVSKLHYGARWGKRGKGLEIFTMQYALRYRRLFNDANSQEFAKNVV